jgi:hypothetical protein
MFKWLKEKATQAAANQCRTNIRLNTGTLVAVSNSASEHINRSGGSTNENDIRRVVKAQEGLLKDIILGHSNGLSLEEIRNAVIDPELEKIEVSDGARLAIEHVTRTAAETLGVQCPTSSRKSGTAMTTTFFQGNVRIDSLDYETTKFRVVENNALVAVRNETHLRLVEDISKIPSMACFEVIAPMTAVEVLEGEIPPTYLHEYSLDHYLALRKHYVGE